MVGLMQNGIKIPYISLDNFVDDNAFKNALNELDSYLLKQDKTETDIFIGYNGTNWASEEFQTKQKNALPLTIEYINCFCKEGVPFNIRYSPKNQNIVLLHQDDAAQLENRTPVNSLIPNYKDYLDKSYYELLINSNEFKIVENIVDANPIYNGLDFNYDEYLKNKFEKEYLNTIKGTYKLHLIMSPQKTMFIYDNVTDTIHHINSKATVFNAKDYHDTLKDSWGISIQFPMHCDFLKNELKKYCELVGND
jgi:hypothetical protein